MTVYKQVSWNGEAISEAKLKQMVNNDQFLFENMPKVRYSVNGLVRDASLKMLVGKTPFPVRSTANFEYLTINFGSFFSQGSHPVVTATVETTGGSMHRSKVVVQGFGGELNHTGFTAIITDDAHRSIATPGWIHWQAVGY